MLTDIIATGGSVSTIIDTNSRFTADNALLNGTAFVTLDAGGAAAAPEGEYRAITGYAASTETFTVGTNFSVAVAAGDYIARADVRLHLAFQDVHRLGEFVAMHGEGKVSRAVHADVLDDHVDFDIARGNGAKDGRRDSRAIREKVQYLIDNPARLHEMASAAIKLARSQTWDRFRLDFQEIIRRQVRRCQFEAAGMTMPDAVGVFESAMPWLKKKET